MPASSRQGGGRTAWRRPRGEPRFGLWLALAALGPAAFALGRLAQARPDVVEDLYSRRVYPVLHDALARPFRSLPFSASEALGAGLCAAAVLWLARLWRAQRRHGRLERSTALAVLVTRGAGCLGLGYALFLLLWGLNYARAPLATTLGLEPRPTSAIELAELALELREEADLLRADVWEDEAGVFRLWGGRADLARRLHLAFHLAARERPIGSGPRPLLRDAWTSSAMTRLGLTGIWSPFTAEAHVNADVPDVSLAFAASHEAAHGLGYAREDEASFVGWLACRASPDPDLRYVGTVGALRQVVLALARYDPVRATAVVSSASPGLRRDLAAVDAFWRRRRTPLASMAARVNDLYIESQGDSRGTRSYGALVDLLTAERRRRLEE